MRTEDDIEVVALPGNVHLVVPEEKRHKWNSVKLLVIFQHELGEIMVVVADVSWKVVDFLAEIFPEAHVLVQLVREFEDRSIHDAYVVDWMCLHGVDDD